MAVDAGCKAVLPSYRCGSSEASESSAGGQAAAWTVSDYQRINFLRNRLLTMALSLFYFTFLAVLGLCCCAGFSLVVRSGGSCLAGMRASHHAGLSCCGTQVLGHEGFSSCRSRAPEHRLSSCGAQA